MLKACAFIVLALAAFIGYVAKSVIDTMTYDKVLSFVAPDACRLLETPTPVEDLTDYNGNSVIAGGGDLWNTFSRGSGEAKDGAFWLIDSSGQMTRIPISGAPPKLIPHGIYFSKRSRRLYAVNHDESTGESVEVFDVKEEEGKVHLAYSQSIRSSLFGNFALNDVVEGDGDEIYVTEWQPFPYPAGGKAGLSTAPFQVKVQRALVILISLVKLPTTRIFRCTLGAASECTVASSQRFIGANGIAVSADRQTVFVNDAPVNQITVLERKPDGALEKVSDFKVKHALDNIEMHDDGYLTGGSIPLLYTCEVVCEDAKELAVTKTMDGREVGCGKSPGGMLQVTLLGTGGKSFVDGTQTDRAMTDGSLMSGVSAAIPVGSGKIALGSPNSPGVVFCDA